MAGVKCALTMSDEIKSFHTIIIRMEIELEPGKYVVAVSGGVDSVVLLHALQGRPGVELVVAHFDHGIRPDSGEDALHVKHLAEGYDLPFVVAEGLLGSAASEAAARTARYAFLRRVQDEHQASAIITAHHQDDMLETVIINLLRGTGRKGLSSLSSREGLKRPLLHIPKSEILDYAEENNLKWREDSSNADENYLRNYIRRQLLPRIDQQSRKKLLNIIINSGESNQEIDTLLVKYLPISSGGNLNRQDFSLLPHAVSREVMAAWLRAYGIRDFDSKTLERLVIVAKTARPHSRTDVLRSVELHVGENDLALARAER